jgi:hypothetical protein
LKKWGTKYNFSSAKFWEHLKAKNKAELGVEHHQQLESWKALYRKISFERYGVSYPMQNREIFSKFMRSSFSTKPYILPSGKEIKVMGYEGTCLDILLGRKKDPLYIGPVVEEKDIMVNLDGIPYQDGTKGRVYFPDISAQGTLIEVKSNYTFDVHLPKNILKFKAAAKKVPFQVWIFGKKKQLVEIITFNRRGKGTLSNGTIYNEEMLFHVSRLEVISETPEEIVFKVVPFSKIEKEEIMRSQVKVYVESPSEKEAVEELAANEEIKLVDDTEIVFEE